MNRSESEPEFRLTPMPLFHTPKTLGELIRYIESLGPDAYIGWTVYGLFNNLILHRLGRGEEIYDPKDLEGVTFRDEIDEVL